MTRRFFQSPAYPDHQRSYGYGVKSASFSAADVYNVFNSDPALHAFELEAIGGARVENGRVKRSILISLTQGEIMASQADAERFLTRNLGIPA